MSELFAQLMAQLNSSVFVLLALVIVVMYALFKLGIWLGEWRQKYSNHEDRLGKVEEKIEKNHELLTTVAARVEIIYEKFNTKKLAESHSPMTITKLGKEVSAAINAPAIFEKYKGVLLGDLAAACGRSPTAYDIQEQAFRIAREQFSKIATPDDIRRFKDVAYQQGFLYEDIWIIFGLLLRDAGLMEHHLPVPEPKD